MFIKRLVVWICRRVSVNMSISVYNLKWGDKIGCIVTKGVAFFYSLILEENKINKYIVKLVVRMFHYLDILDIEKMVSYSHFFIEKFRNFTNETP